LRLREKKDATNVASGVIGMDIAVSL